MLPRDEMIEKRHKALQWLAEVPPWSWPSDAGESLLEALRDPRTAEADLELAAELAGDLTVINDRIVEALLAILQGSEYSETIRGRAALSLGPVLEDADMAAIGASDDVPISQEMVGVIRDSLRAVHADGRVPTEVRRCALEAAVRAPEDWHGGAIRAAFASGDAPWRLTAVFCMRYVRGFDAQIVEALEDPHPDVRREALGAAGTWGLDAAWPYVTALLTSRDADKPLVLEAIDAAAGIRPREAAAVFAHLLESADEDISGAAHEALDLVGGLVEELDDVEDDDDDIGADDDDDDEGVR